MTKECRQAFLDDYIQLRQQFKQCRGRTKRSSSSTGSRLLARLGCQRPAICSPALVAGGCRATGKPGSQLKTAAYIRTRCAAAKPLVTQCCSVNQVFRHLTFEYIYNYIC